MANLRVDKITSTETFETTGSVQFNHNNDNYLSGTITAIGTQDFTIECWVYLLANRSSQHQRFFGNDDGAFDSNTLNMRFTPNLAIQMYYGAQGDVTSDTLSESTWYHVAMSYSDNVARCYIDGKEFGTISGNTDLGNTTMFIGGTYTVGGENFNGHVSNARLIVGKGIYPTNFKPPMRELEVTPETVLLACQSKTDKLEERSGNTTLSATGILHSASELTPGLLTPVPKAGAGSAITGSVEFDGSGPTAGGYLELAKAPFQFLHKGTDSYTVESWVHKQATTQGTIFDTGGTSSTTIGTVLFGDSGGVLKFRTRQSLSASPDATITTGDVMANDMWHHVALSYDKSTYRLFVNGILVGSASYSTESSTDSTQSLKIGAYEYSTDTKDGYFNGYISNLRIVKGTALYTDDFIPPTRELKKVPGTVLLCCQDPDNPLTEATGKTITGYGDLDQVYNTQLVPNGDFSDGTNDWSDTGSTATLSVSSGQMTITNSSGINGRATGSAFKTTIGARYVLKYDAITSGGSYRAEIRQASGGGAEQAFESTTDGVTETFEFQATHSQHSVVIYSIGANGVATKYDNVYVYKVYPGKTGSNFTPQVGDDRKVTSEGVTKVNSDAYFYLPTGDTVTRESRYGRSRGLIVGGGNSDTIEFINIASTGNAQDYGNLSATTSYVSALSSSTRGVYSRSRTPSSPNGDNTLEYSTLASTGNSLDFGDRTEAVYDVGALSSSIRGIIGGGYGPANSDVIDYVTISSTGNARDFGDLTQVRRSVAGLASPTRGCFAAGYQQPDTTTETDIIDYVTIASTGNAVDFGNLTAARWGAAPMASSTRGVFAGGIDPNALNVIDYITIASTGNANDFGDLVQKGTGRNTGISNSVRGVAGIYITPAYQNSWEYITIQSMGNAQDFGESAVDNSGLRGGCSDSHGGLG